jgi:hypothetical protein
MLFLNLEVYVCDFDLILLEALWRQCWISAIKGIGEHIPD